jgi:uncharacterized membrane protein YkgB
MMKKTAATTFFLNSGSFLIRYGLVVILIWIGILKFTQYEADGIRPLAEHSPFFSWAFAFLSTRAFSNILGVIEITTGILIALRPLSPRLSAIGSVAAILTFLTTLTFIVSTPGVIQEGWPFPFISPSPGQFLIKDLVLLGAALWTAGEALAATQKQKFSQDSHKSIIST